MTTAFETSADGLVREHRSIWMSTVRESLDRSVPFAADRPFDDLLAQLDAIPASPSDAASTSDELAGANLARRDAALEAHLSGYVDLLTRMCGQIRHQLAPSKGAVGRDTVGAAC